MNIPDAFIHLGSASFIGAAWAYGSRLTAKAAERVAADKIAALARIAEDTAAARKMHEQACTVFGRVADAMAPVARRAEIELERMDRASPPIPPGTVDLGLAPPDRADGAFPPARDLGAMWRAAGSARTLDILRSVGGINAQFGKLGVSAPDPSKPLDVTCPACSGKEWPDNRCKLCFGSYITSKEAAEAFERARGLAGSF